MNNLKKLQSARLTFKTHKISDVQCIAYLLDVPCVRQSNVFVRCAVRLKVERFC